MGFLRHGVLGLALAVSGLGQTAPAPVWTHAGPAGLQTAAGTHWASPLAALEPAPGGGAVFAAGDGGVWRYAAGQWSGLSNGQPVSALAFSSDGSALYAGTGDINIAPARPGTGIMKSTDGGSTWGSIGAATFAGLAVARIATDPVSPQHLLAAAVSTPATPATATPGLFASSDGGATWSALIAGNVWDVAWSGSSVLALGANQVEISTDNGQHFSPASLAGLPSIWQRAVVCARSGGGFLVLFAGAGTPPTATLAGISAGGTGTTVLSTPPAPLASALGMALASDAAGDILLGGTDLWEQTAGQGAWSKLTASTPLPSQQHAVLVDSTSQLWLANDGGLWSSPVATPPSSVALQSDNLGLANIGIVAFAPAAGLAALDGAALAPAAASSNPSWQVASAPASFSLMAADAADVTGQSGFAAAGGQLWRWSGGGTQWMPIAPAPPVSGVITALASSSAGLWLGDSSGQLLASSDGGETWTLVASPADASTVAAIAVAQGSPEQVWLASGGAVDQSANAGAAWVAVTPLPAPVTSLALDPVHPAVVAAATAASVSVSLDGGTDWTGLNAGLPAAPVTGLYFDAQENLWAATLGRGLWSVPLANAGIALSLTAVPASAPVGSVIALQAAATALGQPLAGAQVRFAAAGAGGSTNWTATAITSADGTAAVSYNLPQASGPVTMTAALNAPAASVQATAPVEATAGPAAFIIVVSGANQSQTEGQVLAEPIVLEVTDSSHNPRPNQPLVLTASGGSFQSPPPTTDSQGQATLSFVLPSAAGVVTLTAAAGTISQSWSETALPLPSYALVLTAPTAAVAPNQNATLTLQITTTGGFNQAVPVQCAAPVPGCSVAPASLAPGQTATVTVALAGLALNQASVPVQVMSGDGTHGATATLALEAFTITADASSLSARTGAASSSATITVTPVNGLVGPVVLTAALASGDPLPATLAPLFQPSSLTLAAGSSPPQAEFSVIVAPAGSGLGLGLAAALALAGLAGRGRRRRWVWLLGLAALAAGCSGAPPPSTDPPPPPVATYPLVITATSSGLTASVPIALTVTQN